MRLWGTLQSVVPVPSHSQERRRAPEPPPTPDIGLRWGKPSAFSFSIAAAQERRNPGVTVNYPEDAPPEVMRIVPSRLNIRSVTAKVEDPARPGVFVEVDRMERMYFSYTEFPPKPTRSSLQPSVTTHYDLRFDLHPPGETPQ